MRKRKRPVLLNPPNLDCNIKVKCVHCGKKFTAHSPAAKFHSASCRRAFLAKQQPMLCFDPPKKGKKQTAREPSDVEIVVPAQSCEVEKEGGES